ncbi:DNA polymerase III subunit gamma/tau [Spongiivirga citrea]|uniref:DNA polymerase III subunit gamma/tau n=1 Tax=Spongiivirga citrea TaxID=1481457 RepID=A0A6M0CKY7_9FLAO|nr:DNA polymerase III subunit gamma/tau [Spongiivirga citrea]NER17643.1 DNA polymerase III subunit gamma/tau [Spongiivirga citrea]
MEHFIVSARKYRPQAFQDVVGQQAITNTLLNAINNNHLAQALLFTGPRGVGKTTCARILAKMINSDGTESPDEDFAFNIFELDAASNNSVDDIRSLIDQVRIPPQVGKYKVYIIDEVHMLSSNAFNAFLKTLEEPPKHAIFILATTEKHKIIPTILSRCQIFDFKRITVGDAKEYLKYIAGLQGVEADDDALHIIAQKADGAMRDALSIFDRVVSFSGNNLTRQAVSENLNVLDYETYFTSTDLILKNNIPQLLLQFNEITAKGFDGHHYVTGLASHFRDLMVCKNEATISLLEVGEQTKAKYLEQSRKTSLSFLLKAIDLANSTDLKYKASKNQRLLVELCLMQLASILAPADQNDQQEKKNDKPRIIPPAHFKGFQIDLPQKRVETVEKAIEKHAESTPPIQEPSSLPAATIDTPSDSPIASEPIAKTEPIPIETKEAVEEVSPTPKTPKLNISSKRVSGLSLSSISRKKEHEKSKEDRQVDEENLPTEPFTEKQAQDAWEAYIKKLQNKGQKNMASIVGIDQPVLRDKKTLVVEYPNDTMRVELERSKAPLLKFLRAQLQNYDVDILVEVNETATKKYAFTPREKYEKLKEKNPLIETLRQTFDLDI